MFGAFNDETSGDEIKVTVIATGFSNEQQEQVMRPYNAREKEQKERPAQGEQSVFERRGYRYNAEESSKTISQWENEAKKKYTNNISIPEFLNSRNKK